MIRESNLYVHHDIMLPAFPLCVEWINYKPGQESSNIGNFAAIGTFDPQIEVWNLILLIKHSLMLFWVNQIKIHS